MAERNIDVVRRPTGGRALLHHREVTYSVTAPIDTDGSLRDSYRRINRILMEALTLLGVETGESSSTAPAPRPGALPCFAEPAAGELVTNGAKLVGSAQLREDGALLQHGSILVEDDQRMIAHVLSVAERRAEIPAAATLTRSLGRTPSVEEVATALFEAVRRLEDSGASPMDEGDIRAATENHLEKYSSEWWTWRR